MKLNMNIFKRTARLSTVCAIMSVFTLAAYHIPFFRLVIKNIEGGFNGILITGGLAVIMLALNYFFYYLVMRPGKTAGRCLLSFMFIGDAISLYFNLRTVPDSVIKEGFERDLEMVLEDTVRFLRFRYDGHEVRKVKGMGKCKTIKFRCKIATSDGYAFQDGTEFEVWISDDKNKIPLYIKSPIKVGSVQAYLSSYEGLRYPLDSFIKK